MADTIVSNDFFSEAFHGVHSLPLKGFALVGGIGVINILVDLALWHSGPSISPSGYTVGGLLMFVSLATVYVVAMMIAEAPLSWLGGIKFLGIMALCVGIPLGLLFGGLLLLRTSGGITAVILGLSLLAALVAIPLLSAWPVTQALSGVFVSPVRILKSTKGYRWGLFTASYASTALNKILPATDSAKSNSQAIILAVGNGAISCISLLLLASIAATAWKFAIRQDATLAKSIEF